MVDLSMFDNATVEEIEANNVAVLGAPLADVLGPAYGDVEQFVVETMLGLTHPEHDETLRKLGIQFGDERACELVIGMTLLVAAQARAYGR